MSRRTKRSLKTENKQLINRQVGRVGFHNASPYTGLLDLTRRVNNSFLREVEDHRFWTPDPFPAPRRLDNRIARVRVPDSSSRRSNVPRGTISSFLPVHLSFRDSQKVVTCVRRKVRKEVIHARGVAGSKVRKPRRNFSSSISCRR